MNAYTVYEKSGFASVRDREIETFAEEPDANDVCRILNEGNSGNHYYVYIVTNYHEPGGCCFDDGPLIHDCE